MSTNLDRNLQIQINEVTTKLRRRQLVESYVTASEIIDLLRKVVSSLKWTSANAVIKIVSEVGAQLSAAQSLQLITDNIVKRVICVIQSTTSDSDYDSDSDPKSLILEELREMLEEISSIHESICKQAPEHIHANEIILTYGKSYTILEFLKQAARKRKFEVVVVEAAPSYSGHEAASLLADAKIETTLITDSAVFAIMSRVNKVIIGTRAIMANGGLIAPAGTHLIAQAAKHFAVPVVVCSSSYKISPLYPHEYDAFTELNSPAPILHFDEANIADKSVEVYNPAYDYVPPELVSLFITEITSCPPSYIYRLIAENYQSKNI
eukprot:TRINITY_DN1141_c0_g1_i1.p1 TRINITY_DN1141_c0_g1~~TRINITY_DN1141_c0_g1_i1.p1  ORF type:complete len:323 (-),score=145.08 TRINITY_DN1141_c0_g1_i1:735-1703(-)